MKIARVPMSASLRRDIANNIEIGRRSRAAESNHMRTRSSNGAAAAAVGLVGGFWLAVIAINVSVGAFCLQYLVSFWSLYFTHVAKHLPFLPAAVAGLIVGPAAITLSVVTWVLSFAL